VQRAAGRAALQIAGHFAVALTVSSANLLLPDIASRNPSVAMIDRR
jgi:hypothetical protein